MKAKNEINASTFYKNFPKNSDYDLTLFFIPSPGLDWSTPGSLTRSTLKHKLLKRPRSLGHVCVMLRSDDETENVFTGMTQKFAKEGMNEVLKEGFGLGILFHNFVGELEDKDELSHEMHQLSLQPNRLSYLKFDLSFSNKNRLVTFFKEYREKNGDRYYGMRNRPRYLEGGGCGPFAAAVLEVAGLLDAEMSLDWQREIILPLPYIGGPTFKRKVSAFKMLTCPAWATKNEPHEVGHFWDPTNMHEWLLKKSPLKTWNQAVGLEIDSRKKEAPHEPLFLTDSK